MWGSLSEIKLSDFQSRTNFLKLERMLEMFDSNLIVYSGRKWGQRNWVSPNNIANQGKGWLVNTGFHRQNLLISLIYRPSALLVTDSASWKWQGLSLSLQYSHWALWNRCCSAFLPESLALQGGEGPVRGESMLRFRL